MLSTRGSNAGLTSHPGIDNATPGEWIIEFAPAIFAMPRIVEKLTDVLLVITVKGLRQ
ncbi:MAG: hypothetical protein H8M99_05985 [Gloeobacteraceae cyanobacterium ES-bin-144]|nr:hypothetical protein [Verrucomicrobiales bacterium]